MSFIILLLMSLTVTSNQAKDKTRPTQVVANQTSAAKTQATSKEAVRPGFVTGRRS